MRNILKNIFDDYSYEIEDDSVVIVLLADISSSIIKMKDFYNWPDQRINTIFYDFYLMLRKILKSIQACEGNCDMSFVYDNIKHAEKFFDDIPKRRYFGNFITLKKGFYEFTLTLIGQKYAINLNNEFWFVTLDEYIYEGKVDPPKPRFKTNHDYFFLNSGDEYADEDILDKKYKSNKEGQNSTILGDDMEFKRQNTNKMLDTCNQDENKNFKKGVIFKKTQKTILDMLKGKENINTNQNKKKLNDFSDVDLETKIACIESFCNNCPENKLVLNNFDTESNVSKINSNDAFSVLMNASKKKFGKKN